MSKEKLVEDLVEYYGKLNRPLLSADTNNTEVKDWFAEVAAVLKQLDKEDYLAFNELKNNYFEWGNIYLEENVNRIDRFLRQKVAEYRRHDFSPKIEKINRGKEICISVPTITIPKWIKDHIPELLITITGGLIVAYLAFRLRWI